MAENENATMGIEGAPSSDGSSGSSSSPEKTALKKNLIICSVVVGFIMNIVSLIFAILAFIEINKYTNEFESIVETWNAAPVTEITFGLRTAGCPAGWNQLVSGGWGGIADACNCNSKRPNTNSTSDPDNACNSQQLQDGCQTKSGWGSVSTPLFLDGQGACFKTSGPSALNRPPLTNGACASGNVLCGNASLGEFAFCFPGTQCPLTDVWIGPTFPSGNITSNDTAFALAQTINSEPPINVGNLSMFYKRGGMLNLTAANRTKNCPPSGGGTCNLNVYGFPIIEFFIDSGIPCYLGEGRGWSGRGGETSSMQDNFQSKVGGPINYNRGFILNRADSGCKEQFDSRIVGVYGELERNMFFPYVSTAGGNTPQGNIPIEFLTSSTDYRWYLSYKHEVQWANAAQGCSITRQQLNGNSQDVKKLKSAQTALIALTLIAFIFLGLVGCCVTLNILMKDNDGKIEKGEDGYKTMCGLKIANYVMKVAMYICVITSIVLAFSLVGVFAEITKTGTQGSVCTDDLSLSSFKGLATIIDGLSKKNMIQGFTNMIDFFTEVFHQIISCIC